MESGVYYHKYNALKTRILTELKKAKRDGEVGITCQMISDRTGIPRHRITDIMGKWIAKHYKYVRRLNKKQPGGNGKNYRYAITTYGEKALRSYAQRTQNHYDLNLRRRARDVGESYIGVTRKGVELGITVSDVWKEFDKTKDERKKQVDV